MSVIVGGPSAGFLGREIGTRLIQFCLRGFDVRLQRGVRDGGHHRAGLHGLSVLYRRAAHDAAGFGAHCLPLRGLHLAVGGQDAHQGLALDTREAHLGRVVLAQHAPYEDRRYTSQQQEQQQFLQELGSKNHFSDGCYLK